MEELLDALNQPQREATVHMNGAMLVLAGAGWYFSGLIYEVGFNVNNQENINAGTSEDIIFVEEIKEDSVVLNVQNERWGPLLENGIYGVIGANGFIIVNFCRDQIRENQQGKDLNGFKRYLEGMFGNPSLANIEGKA